MYVYLMSGVVDMVPSVSRLTLSERTVTLQQPEGDARQYPRSSVYLISRDLISPPVPF